MGKDREIMDLDPEESINQDEIGNGVLNQQEDRKQEATSSQEQNVS